MSRYSPTYSCAWHHHDGVTRQNAPCVHDFWIGNQTHFFLAAPTNKLSIASVKTLLIRIMSVLVKEPWTTNKTVNWGEWQWNGTVSGLLCSDNSEVLDTCLSSNGWKCEGQYLAKWMEGGGQISPHPQGRLGMVTNIVTIIVMLITMLVQSKGPFRKHCGGGGGWRIFDFCWQNLGAPFRWLAESTCPPPHALSIGRIWVPPVHICT